MKSGIRIICLILLVSMWTGIQIKARDYVSVPNDPLKARIYTLDNGLKVYMSVNKETPRIQTFIAVRVGGKNDPAETTGLAHYFEHLMFKGTKQFGTQNYAQEELLLNQIEQLFEVYRKTTDESERKSIYRVIDSLSYEASKISIPNEYDKLMAAIGAKNTNAYTSYDMTVYTEDIPSNQVENWAKIQSDRFQNSVIRGFHTELETVYEEKNMSLTSDQDKVIDNLFASLYPHHPYGTQTILGSQEHLKNPSITNIKNYYKQWYVPNNMAICLSGDFDPDQMIKTIDQYFGQLKPNTNLPKLQTRSETSISSPIIKDVYGLDGESVTIGWRFPGVATKDYEMLQVIDQIVCNSKAGLIDLDLNQQQKVIEGTSFTYGLADYSSFILTARPKEGQSLDNVKKLLLSVITKLKKGQFDEKILSANINNLKLYQLYQLEHNSARANNFVQAFINGVDWKDEVASIDNMAKITKKEIIAFANKNFGDNYVVINKKQGADPNEKKISKPEITPIFMNRDTVSNFLVDIQASTVNPIEPVFIEFDKDMEQFTFNSQVPVLYKQNTSNDLFQMLYVFDMGNNNDKLLGEAFQYMKYLGTSKMSAEKLNSELYRLACRFEVYPDNERTFVVLNGLNENMPQTVELFEQLLADAQVNKDAYANLANDIIKSRADDKLNQDENFDRLQQYAFYGPQSPATNILSNKELSQLNPQELIDRIHSLNTYKHRIMYYGPSNKEQLLAVLEKYHKIPNNLKEVPQGTKFEQQLTPENNILLAQYDSKQINMGMVSNKGEKYDISTEPVRRMYNGYFGGGMNSIVFQEMREARGLAYTAWAGMIDPDKKEKPYYMITFIASQNDKMIDAIKTFDDIINNIPESETAFKLAKDKIINQLRSERITKANILWSYINAQDMGRNGDIRKQIYNDIQNMTLKDVLDYQKKWVKGRKYTYCILGDKKDLDLESLSKYGTIQELSQEAIFGY